jgi:hypothetical protein
MSTWVEKLVIPLLLLLAGGVGTVFWQYVTSQEVTYVTAEMKWLDGPNPIYGVDAKQLADVDKAISAATGLNFSTTPFRFEKRARVAVITFRNFSNVRSKEVELITKQDSVLYSPDADDKRQIMGRRIKLKRIDPQESATVYAMVAGWPYSVAANLSALHDNKKLNIFSTDSEEVENVFAAGVAQFPIAASILMFMGAITLFLLLLIVPFQIAQAISPRIKNRLTSDAVLKSQMDWLGYIEKEHPERIAKIRAAPAKS